MLLFCKPNTNSINNIIVPLARVYNIISNGCRVIIDYNGGDCIEVENGNYQNKITEVVIYYDSEDEVNKAIRQFFRAVNSNANAFFFGQRQEVQPYNNNQ